MLEFLSGFRIIRQIEDRFHFRIYRLDLCQLLIQELLLGLELTLGFCLLRLTTDLLHVLHLGTICHHCLNRLAAQFAALQLALNTLILVGLLIFQIFY